MAAARVAADARMNVDFDDEALSGIFHARRAELDAAAEDRRVLERERDDAERRREHDALRASTSKPDASDGSEPQKSNNDTEPSPDEPDYPGIDR
jgi:hypothetical protein